MMHVASIINSPPTISSPSILMRNLFSNFISRTKEYASKMSYFTGRNSRCSSTKPNPKDVLSPESRIDLAMREISSYIGELGEMQMFIEKQLAEGSLISLYLRQIKHWESLMTCPKTTKSPLTPLFIVFSYARIIWHINEFGIGFTYDKSNHVSKMSYVHENDKFHYSNLLLNVFGISYDIMTTYLNALTDPGSGPRECNHPVGSERNDAYIEFINNLIDKVDARAHKGHSCSRLNAGLNGCETRDRHVFMNIRGAYEEAKCLRTLTINKREYPVIPHPSSVFTIACGDHCQPSVILQVMVTQTLEHVIETLHEERAYHKGAVIFLKSLYNPDVMKENRSAYLGKVTGFIDEFSGKKKVHQMMLRLKAELSEKEKILRRKFERQCPCKCLLHLQHTAK